MKELSIREIQLQSLDIMKDIHEFCIENDIKYTLAYGSMLGAIRHKGFIPWDDDIDVMMPRKDWEKFSRDFVSKRGYRILSAYDKDNYMIYTRVYDNKNTIVTYPAPTSKYENLGVWVDVLPIDGLPSDITKVPFKRLCSLLRNTVSLRISMLQKVPLFKRIKRAIKSSLYRLPNIHGSIILFHKIARRYDFGTTEKCSNLCCRDALDSGKMEVLYTSDFLTCVLMPFEDTSFYVASGYDRILKMTYGDYKQLPPPEKQIVRHSFATYYQKD